VLDTIPHWENWFGKQIYGFPSGTPIQKMPIVTIASGVLDLLAAIGMIALVLQSHGGAIWSSPLFWGAIGGFLPDLLDNVPIVSSWTARIPGVLKERSFHERIHISETNRRAYPYLTGLLTQLTVVALSLIMLVGK
jgi:hypothetical protein